MLPRTLGCETYKKKSKVIKISGKRGVQLTLLQKIRSKKEIKLDCISCSVENLINK